MIVNHIEGGSHVLASRSMHRAVVVVVEADLMPARTRDRAASELAGVVRQGSGYDFVSPRIERGHTAVHQQIQVGRIGTKGVTSQGVDTDMDDPIRARSARG